MHLPGYFYLAFAGMALCVGIGLFLSRGTARLWWFSPAIVGIATCLTAIAPGVFPTLFDPQTAGCSGKLPKSWFVCPDGYPFQVYVAYLQFYLVFTLLACAAFAGWIGLAIGLWHLLTRNYGDDDQRKDDHQTPL